MLYYSTEGALAVMSQPVTGHGTIQLCSHLTMARDHWTLLAEEPEMTAVHSPKAHTLAEVCTMGVNDI